MKINKKTMGLLAGSILFFISARASIEKPAKQNSATIESAVNYFSVRLLPLQESDTSLKFAPNSNGRYGVTLSLWGASAFVGSASGESEAELARYGHTEYKDYRLFFPITSDDSWFVSGYYTSYTGIHIEDFSPLQSSTSFEIKRSTMNITNAGSEIYYVLSPNNFSLSAALFQSTIQTSPGIGLIFSIAQDQFTISDNQTLAPSPFQSGFGADSNITRSQFKSALLNVGIGATSVQDKYSFISIMVMGGYGYQIRTFGNDELTTEKSGPVQKVYGVLTIGNNNPKAFYGVNGYIDQMTSQTNSIQFVRNLSALKLFLGIRF